MWDVLSSIITQRLRGFVPDSQTFFAALPGIIKEGPSLNHYFHVLPVIDLVDCTTRLEVNIPPQRFELGF